MSVLNYKSATNSLRKFAGLGAEEIDLMVYKLYKLTYDEVRIVAPDFAMSREEYEQFNIKE